MTKENQNVYDAKKSLKYHIKFMESLLAHLNSSDEVLKGRALWASWCIHNFFNRQLVDDIKKAIAGNKENELH
jgi:hypothetical protein